MNPSKSTLSAKDRAYLIAAGWKEEPIGDTLGGHWWLDPRKDAAFHKRNGGYCDPSLPLKRQREYDRFDKGIPIYAVCRAQDGYGYLLRKCIGVDEPWVTVWRHHDEGEIKAAIKLLECDAVFKMVPDTHVYPYILAFEEKHGTYHYDASTRELFHKACLAMVKRRNEEECWYEYETVEEQVVPALTEEQVAGLKSGYIKDAALDEWKSYKAQLKRLDGEKAERALLSKALKGDGEAAAEFLRARKDAEYEGMELIELDEIE